MLGLNDILREHELDPHEVAVILHTPREARLRRSPRDFRFSILERVSPDMPREDVLRLERNWIARLDTITHGLNT